MRTTAGSLRRAFCGAAAIGVSLGFLWLLGLAWFATPPAPENGTRRTDAIVVLTGGSGRIASGIDLLREGTGRALFVSGVDPRVDLATLWRSAETEGAQPQCCIVLGHDAANTMENARETALWVRRHGYRSLRLVTAWYHMPRSLLVFRRAMPDIAIIAHPVFPDEVRLSRWWAWRGTAILLIGEYDKYLATLFWSLIDYPRPIASEPAEADGRR